jgi:hypothetical protein
MTAAVLTFDTEQHQYRLRGIPVPSVTQVLKQTGYIRLDAIPPAVLEAARDRGQRVHQALHYLFEDDLDESTVADDIAGYLESARLYMATHVREVLRAEMRVWHDTLFCAGTLDVFGIHADGGLFVGDFKTGDPADVAADLQLAAYVGFLSEMRKDDAELDALIRTSDRPTISRRSIRLFRDGRPARETYYSSYRDYSRFLNALSIVHDQAKRPALTAWDDER